MYENIQYIICSSTEVYKSFGSTITFFFFLFSFSFLTPLDKWHFVSFRFTFVSISLHFYIIRKSTTKTYCKSVGFLSNVCSYEITIHYIFRNELQDTFFYFNARKIFFVFSPFHRTHNTCIVKKKNIFDDRTLRRKNVIFFFFFFLHVCFFFCSFLLFFFLLISSHISLYITRKNNNN